MRRIVSLILSLLLLATSAAPVSAIDEDAVIVAGDVFVARPLGIVSAIIGGAIFLVALPFAATSDSVRETADILIDEPIRFSFKRPVGDLSPGASYGKRHYGGKQKSTAAKPPAEQAARAETPSEAGPQETKTPAAE